MSEQGEVRVELKIDVSSFLMSAERAGRAAHGLSVALMRSRTRRRHVMRCHKCSPLANPKPLAIDGRMYRQRSKKRGRR